VELLQNLPVAKLSAHAQLPVIPGDYGDGDLIVRRTERVECVDHGHLGERNCQSTEAANSGEREADQLVRLIGEEKGRGGLRPSRQDILTCGQA
jgi:hypothetical protein